MPTDHIISHIENYKQEIKKITDWELEIEMKVQIEARTYTREMIELYDGAEAEQYQLDYTLIIFRLVACAEESKRRFIP